MSREVKTMMETPIETPYLSRWKLTNSGQTGKKPALDQTSPSECGRQLYGLGRLQGHWQWHQDLSLLLVLAFGETILFGGIPCSALHRYSRDSLGPSSKPCALPSLRSGWWVVEGMGGGEGVGTVIGM